MRRIAAISGAMFFFCDRDRQFYLADPAVWAEWLALAVEAEAFGRLRQATGTGRPCAAKEFVENLEQTHARALTPRKRGRKSKYDAIK